MKKAVFEILKEVSEQSSRQKKIQLLQQNYSLPLIQVLQYALDPRIKWLLPEGDAPYKPNPYPGSETALYSEARRLYLFVEGGNPNLSRVKRETLFIQLLEVLHPEDAKLIIAIKDKKLPYKGITAKLVNEAFPGLIQEEENGENKAKA